MTSSPFPRRLLTALCLFLFVVAPVSRLAAQTVNWLSKTQVGQTLYFFFPDRAERYDLTTRAWLAPIVWPTGRSGATAAAADADGLYVAYGTSLYRSALDGTGEQHLLNLSNPVSVRGVASIPGIIFVRTSSSAVSIVKATNQVGADQSIFTSSRGLSAAPGLRKVFARTTGVSPSDLQSFAIATNGTVTAVDSPYHGDYPDATTTWVTGDEASVIDNSGTVYATTDLRVRALLGQSVSDLAPIANTGAFVTVSGNRLTRYAAALYPEAGLTLAFMPQGIVVAGAEILCFTNGSGGLQVEAVALSSLAPPTPGPAVDPLGLAYTPDAALLDKDGILLLLSKTHKSIFRWDPATQKYLTSIPLLDAPSRFAYSAPLHRIYVGYPTGLVRSISLQNGLTESFFAQLPNAVAGLVAAGSYCITLEGANSTGMFRSFAPDGTQIEAVSRYLYSSVDPVWSDVNQKVYFYDGIYVQTQEVNATGTAYPGEPPGGLGAAAQYYLGGSSFTSPFRISPDGQTLVTAGGAIHNALTLVRSSNSLANAVSDLAWQGNALSTLRTVDGSAVFQQWVGATYAPGLARDFPGTAQRLFALSGNRFLGLTLRSNGVPFLFVVDADFNPLPPPALLAPGGLQASLTSASVIALRWADTPGATGFIVQRRQNRGDWADLGSTGRYVTTFTDAPVTTGQTYEYRILATDGTVNSPASVPISISVATPQPPTDLVLGAVTANSIGLRWAAASGATGYRVERMMGSGTFTFIGNADAATRTFTDNNISSNRLISYRVRATNPLGESEPSNVVSVQTAAVQPYSPYLSASAIGQDTVSLTVYASNNPDYTEIERQTAAGWSVIGTIAATASSYLDTGLSPGTPYSYRARSFNSAGVSPYSSVAQVTTQSPQPPQVPSIRSARVLSGGRIELRWFDITGELGYRVQRQVGEGAWTDLASFGADVLQLEDSSLAFGTRASYRVIAFNAVGSSGPSDPVSITLFDLVRVAEDSFDPAVHAGVWQQIQGGVAFNGGQGFGGSNALWFGAAGARSAQTAPNSLTGGAYLGFRYRAGNEAVDGGTYWNNSEYGEELVLEYSTGSGWEYLTTLPTDLSAGSWRSVEFAVPTAALSAQTSFRIRQLDHSGAGLDTWAIDDFFLDTGRPAAPLAPGFVFAGATSDTQIAISWEASNGAARYRVERALGPNGPWSPVVSTFSVTHHTDVQLTPATWYAYRVVAENAGGASAPSLLAWAQTYSQLAAWQLANFGTTTGAPAVDADGVSTLSKFAFGLPAGGQATTHPVGGTQGGLPAVWREPSTGRLQVEFVRRRAASNPGIAYQVEFTGDLESWTATATLLETVILDQTWERVRFEDATGGTRRLGRVRVISQ